MTVSFDGAIISFVYEVGYMKKSVVMLVILISVLLGGCGDKKMDATGIIVNDDGSLSYVLVEDFNEDYYDLEELKSMAEEEISEYNAEYTEARIVLKDAEILDTENGRKVRMTVDYSSSNDFSYFNQETFFFGTVSDAIGKGYSLSDALVSSDGERVSEGYYDANPDLHIIITGSKVNIITPYNIAYSSQGVKYLGKKEAALTDATGSAVQLLLSK